MFIKFICFAYICNGHQWPPLHQGPQPTLPDDCASQRKAAHPPSCSAFVVAWTSSHLPDPMWLPMQKQHQPPSTSPTLHHNRR